VRDWGTCPTGPALAQPATRTQCQSLNSEQQKEVLLAWWRPADAGLLQETARALERIWAYSTASQFRSAPPLSCCAAPVR